MSTFLSKIRGRAPLFVVVALVFLVAMVSWEYFQTEGVDDTVETDQPSND
jgi:hypothetical protein